MLKSSAKRRVERSYTWGVLSLSPRPLSWRAHTRIVNRVQVKSLGLDYKCSNSPEVWARTGVDFGAACGHYCLIDADITKLTLHKLTLLTTFSKRTPSLLLHCPKVWFISLKIFFFCFFFILLTCKTITSYYSCNISYMEPVLPEFSRSFLCCYIEGLFQSFLSPHSSESWSKVFRTLESPWTPTPFFLSKPLLFSFFFLFYYF